MNDKTRFAKLFIIITEICITWLKDLIRTRIPPQMSIETYIHQRGNEKMLKEPTIKEALESKNKKENDDFDVSALDKIIKIGKCVEGHPYQRTIIEAVNDIRLQRNDFMHTTKASKDENEYNDLVQKFRSLAEKFEMFNNKPGGDYKKQIEEIDTKIFDEEEVRNTVIHYNKWIMVVKKIEIPTLTVPGPPSVYIQHPSYNVIHGQAVTLECKVSSEHVTSVSWQRNKNGYTQTISSNTNVNKYRGSTPNSPSLTIFNVTSEDAGGYLCIATNNHGNGESAVTNLCVDECPPSVSIRHSSYNETAGRSVELACNVPSSSNVESITWQKRCKCGIKTIQPGINSNKYSGSTPYSPSLTILTTSVEDAGYYTCFAKNRFGTGESETIDLSISGTRPTVKTVESEYRAESSGTVTLECIVDSELTDVYWEKEAHYRKETIMAKTDTRKYSGSTPRKPSLTIYNVDINDEGRYTCFVTNSYGKGKSESTSLIVKKNTDIATKRLAAEFSSNFDNPAAAAITGAVGGGVGVVVDTVTGVMNFFKS